MVTKRNYKYTWSLLPAVLVVTGNLLGGWWVGLNTLFSLVILGLIEHYLPENKDNHSHRNDWFPDALLYAHVGMQVAAVSSLLYHIYSDQPPAGFVLLAALSTGINTGASGIVIAHELIHRREPWFRLMGKLMLFTAGNFYFCVDHVKGHHRWVGTDHDPSTSRKGESVYAFMIRSISGQARSSMHLEVQRLRHMGAFPFSLRNYVISAVLLQCAVLILIAIGFGPAAVLAVFVQALVAAFLLEYTQYIEHYGLSRQGMERVSEIHSWQTDKLVSRFFLIDLSRHADHHYHASKPYHTLLSHPGSPVLPGGYVTLILPAMIPPLFFRKIHPVLEDFEKQNAAVS